jgi:carbamoyltransferase
MKHYLGLSAGYHDAAATVLNSNGNILFAGHSERYSKQKNDPNLCNELLAELCEWQYDTVAFYERPWMHNLQQLYSGQKKVGPWTTRGAFKKYLGSWYQHSAKNEISYPHHLCHAAAGFQTSPYDRATVVVIDAIGEWDTISIWGAEYDSKNKAVYKKLWGQKYPKSIGLFYSAITDRLGLRPMDEEYITMGMAAYGEAKYTNTMRILAEENLHVGTGDMFLPLATDADIAAPALRQ